MILSVSRRTDIPAFYSNWFINRLKKGFVYVRNPINKNQISEINISPQVVDCIVFWTKNPKPFLNKLSELSEYNYYFQYTLNSYGNDLEPNVPNKNMLIKSFRELSDYIGKEKVIWRYDPIIVTKKYTIEYHLKYFELLAQKLSLYTEKCVISFVDLYKKTKLNLKEIFVDRLTENETYELLRGLKQIASKYHIEIATCAEKIDLGSLGIQYNKCIDNTLIDRVIKGRISSTKDRNQRKECGCVESIDIGAYNTCNHGCLYCYANNNLTIATNNFKNHLPDSPLLFGQIGENDKITQRKVKSIIENLLF